MTKRLWQYLFIAWFTVASVVVPYREARAIVPLIPVAISLVTSAGAVIASDALLTHGLAILGAMAVAAIVSMPGDTRIRIPLTDDQAATNGAMPAPIAAATTTGVTTYTYTVNAAPGGSGSSEQAACQNLVDNSQSACSNYGTTCSGATVTSGKCYYTVKNNSSGSSYLAGGGVISKTSPVVSCPAGYVTSGATCALSDARLAVPDNNYDLSRSGGSLSAPAKEADTAPGNLQVVDGGGKIWGTNANGEPFVTTITPSAGGTQISTQTQTASGIQSNSITVAATGTISNVQSGTNAGSISLPTTAGVAPTVAVGAATNPISITFPTDYARAGEAGSAANTINTRLDRIHDDLTNPAEVPEAPALPVASEFTDGFFNETFDSLKAWRVPGHSGQCPTADLSFNAWGHYFDIGFVSHCQILESTSVKSTAEVSFTVLWLIAALFIVLGA